MVQYLSRTKYILLVVKAQRENVVIVSGVVAITAVEHFEVVLLEGWFTDASLCSNIYLERMLIHESGLVQLHIRN